MRTCGRWLPVLLIFALTAAACRRPLASFATNTDIPLGHVQVQVARIEPGQPIDWRQFLPAGAPYPPGEPEVYAQAQPEDRLYDVYVSVSGLATIDDPSDRGDYIGNFLGRNATLVDADGDAYKPEFAVMESRVALAYGRASAMWWDDRYWVLRFRTPEVSRDFTLVLRNPDVQPGQPARASVHLGTPGGTR